MSVKLDVVEYPQGNPNGPASDPVSWVAEAFVDDDGQLWLDGPDGRSFTLHTSVLNDLLSR
jgi:hypothetical protein